MLHLPRIVDLDVSELFFRQHALSRLRTQRSSRKNRQCKNGAGVGAATADSPISAATGDACHFQTQH